MLTLVTVDFIALCLEYCKVLQWICHGKTFRWRSLTMKCGLQITRNLKTMHAKYIAHEDSNLGLSVVVVAAAVGVAAVEAV